MPITRNNVLVFIRPSSLTAARGRISGCGFVSVEEVAETKQPPELRLYSHTCVVCECMALHFFFLRLENQQ